MNYEEFLVPVEIAKELKEIGFNEPCLFVLNPHNTLILSSEVHDKGIIDIRKIKPRSNGKLGEDFYSVPTYEQVFKWFGEKGYTCHFTSVKQPPMYIGSRYAWSYEVLNNGKVITCDTYKDARLECIRELIRIYKNN
jgi:hypothetical protein|nr:MAG TPA: hypothetical protein [Caudoviricetes sp.]